MNKKVECIKRLFKKNQSYNEICEWLVAQKLATQQEVNSYTRDQERADFIYNTLLKAEEDEFLQLLDFEWTILPLETIKITCVTEREEIVFAYGH